MNSNRYSVSNSVGPGFAVWDKVDRKVVARYATFKAAQRDAQKRNRA